jgi:hypothetical protein
MLLGLETLDLFSPDFTLLIQFRLNLELISLVQFLVLLIIEDVLQVFLSLCKCDVIENVRN